MDRTIAPAAVRFDRRATRPNAARLAQCASPTAGLDPTMIARPTRTDWLLLLALGVMWGTSYAFIKLGVETLSTFTLIAYRLAIGLGLLATVVLVAREPLPRSARTYFHLAVMAAINIVMPFTLITWAELTVDSAIAAILNGAVPLIVIVLAALTFHDEPITAEPPRRRRRRLHRRHRAGAAGPRGRLERQRVHRRDRPPRLDPLVRHRRRCTPGGTSRACGR